MSKKNINNITTILNNSSVSQEIPFSVNAENVNVSKTMQLTDALSVLDSNIRNVYGSISSIQEKVTNISSEIPSLQIYDPGYSTSAKMLIGKIPQDFVSKAIDDNNFNGTYSIENLTGATERFDFTTPISFRNSYFYKSNYAYANTGFGAVRIHFNATAAQKVKLSGVAVSGGGLAVIYFYKLNTDCNPSSTSTPQSNVLQGQAYAPYNVSQDYKEIEYDLPAGESFIDIKVSKNTSNKNSYHYIRVGSPYKSFYCQIYNPIDSIYNGQQTIYWNDNGYIHYPIYIDDTISSSTNNKLPSGYYIAYFNAGNWYFNTNGTIPGLSESLQEVWDRIDNIHIDDATSTEAGVVKVRLDTTTNTLYMTNNGNNA